MTPLQKCREAKELTLEALSTMLAGIKGGSVSSLHRMETSPVNSVNKNLSSALLDIFKKEGLMMDHLLSPETFPTFKVNYTRDIEKPQSHEGDEHISSLNEKEIIINETSRWLEKSAMSVAKFSIALYEKLAQDNLVKPQPTDVSEYTKWTSNAKKRVGRILDGDTFPLEWKNYWISCLPDEISMKVIAYSIANTGYMVVPLPVTTNHEVLDSRARIDTLSREFADVIGSSKPAMDGFYDNADSKEDLQLLQDELLELSAAALRESTVIEKNTGVKPKLAQIWQNSPLHK